MGSWVRIPRGLGFSLMSVRSKSCPDENVVAQLMEGLLPEDQAKQVHRHIHECQSCSALLSWIDQLDEPSLPDRLDLSESPVDVERPHEATPDATPQVIDRFEVIRTLGRGGMGVVYLARDPRLKRMIAIKVMRAGLEAFSDTEEVQHFLTEAQLLAALSHPNVVSVHDVGFTDTHPFIAEEYVPGHNVRNWVAKAQPTWCEVVAVYRSAGQGLAAAHRAGLVHRDIKPDNLLVGDDGRVCVTDFGLATTALTRKNPTGLADDDLTHRLQSDVLPICTEAVGGTPAYMAPEALKGRRADARSDQFSFAVSLFESLTGQRPFLGRTPDELIQSITTRRIDAAARSKLPAPVRAAILRALSAEPSQRYPTMETLLDKLEQALQSSSRSPHRRRSHALRALSAASVALVAGVLVLGWLLAHRSKGATLTDTASLSPPASVSPDSPAGQRASGLRRDAMKLFTQRQGRQCLAALDEADVLDPASQELMDFTRAGCEMLSGRCEQGKQRMRKYLKATEQVSPQQSELAVGSTAHMYCSADSGTVMQRFRRIDAQVRTAYLAGHVDRCQQLHSNLQSLLPKLQKVAKPPSRSQIFSALKISAECLAQNGRCQQGYLLYERAHLYYWDSQMAKVAHLVSMNKAFRQSFPQCAEAVFDDRPN